MQEPDRDGLDVRDVGHCLGFLVGGEAAGEPREEPLPAYYSLLQTGPELTVSPQLAQTRMASSKRASRSRLASKVETAVAARAIKGNVRLRRLF